jgi:hypothetical protein
VCGSALQPDPAWDTPKQRGWRCALGSLAHYLDARAQGFKAWFFREWIIPPAENYPGVRRGDIQAFRPMPIRYDRDG